MADDLGWGEVGDHSVAPAERRLSTPNLDRFASGGIRFTHAYAGYTICGPSRAALFTGYHSGHFEAKGLADEYLSDGSDAVLLPELLRQAGYVTVAFGKTDPLESPATQGFDTFLGCVNVFACHDYYPRALDQGTELKSFNLSLNWAIQGGASAVDVRSDIMQHPQDFSYSVDVIQAQAIAWVRSWAEGQGAPEARKPFFLYLSHTAPHAGGWSSESEDGAPVPSQGGYATQVDWPEVERDHAATVSYLDGCVGEMLDLLEELGLESTTLAMFASDNGAHSEGGHDSAFFTSSGSLSGFKRSLFEGGVRSPTLARWPGTISAGVSSFQWAFWDVMPTLAELAGVSPPDSIDGTSIVPTLKGEAQEPKDYLYWTWGGDGEAPSGRHCSGFAVVADGWKGVVPYCAESAPSDGDLDAMQVYDLTSDAAESTDLAGTADGQAHAQQLHALVMQAGVTCKCFSRTPCCVSG